MNAQRAYEYLNSGKTDLKGLIEALTGEPEKVEEPVKVGDMVRFSEGTINSGIGEVCYVYYSGAICVGLDTSIDGYGWEWTCRYGSEYAKKRGFKYVWGVEKGNYTIIGRA